MRRFAYLLILFVFPVSVSAQAQPETAADEAEWLTRPSKVLAFADHLFETGDYQRAIGEYKRFVYLFAQEPRALQARFKIGVSYEKLSHFDNAIELFEEILKEGQSEDVTTSVKYEIGKCYFLGTDYSRAAEAFEELGTDRSLIMAGWSLVRAGKHAEASKILAGARDVNPEGYLSGLASSLSVESLEGEKMPSRSPALALALSVPVPGAGRAYCGRFGDALFSFLLVAASYAGAYHYYDMGERLPAAGFLGLGVFFHAGDLYGAANSARRFNETNREAFVERIESRHNLRSILLD